MTANSFFVYRHIRLDTNQPFYIGIGKKPKKFNGHKTEYKRAYNTTHRNKVWKNIVVKTEYKVQILMESSDLEFIKEKERELIALYKTKWNGGTLVNLTSGGDFNPKEVGSFRKRGYKHSKEVREKISKAIVGRKLSEDHVKKQIEFRTGRSRPNHSIKMRNQGKIVLDVTTGIYYDSLIDACEATEYDYRTAVNRIYYKSKNARFIKAY